MSIRIIHGANVELCGFQGRTVGYIRKALREVINLPSDAVAFIGGRQAMDDRVINDGESVEFVRKKGIKGLGALLTPDQLKEQWQIDDAGYRQLLDLGLPRIQLPSGVRHPEIEVDEFFRQRAVPINQEESRNSSAERIAGALEEVANRLPNLAGPPMTVDQVAKFASVSEKTIYRWVGTGKLKPKADGARPLLFERSEVDKALSRS